MKCVTCKCETDDVICRSCEIKAEKQYDADSVTSRITGQDKVFVGLVAAEVEMEEDKPHHAGFICYKARKVMQNHYGVGNTMIFTHVEDYNDYSSHDWENAEPMKGTMLVVRFLNPKTSRFYFEQITILNLRDEDYESCNIEKVAI